MLSIFRENEYMKADYIHGKQEKETFGSPDVVRSQFSPVLNTMRHKVDFHYNALHSLYKFYILFFLSF